MLSQFFRFGLSSVLFLVPFIRAFLPFRVVSRIPSSILEKLLLASETTSKMGKRKSSTPVARSSSFSPEGKMKLRDKAPKEYTKIHIEVPVETKRSPSKPSPAKQSPSKKKASPAKKRASPKKKATTSSAMSPTSPRRGRKKANKEEETTDAVEPFSPTPKKSSGGGRKKKEETATNKFEEVVNEENRPIVNLLNEISGRYFVHGDQQRGIAYQNAAKHIRETAATITSGEEAKQLEGVGEHIGDHIEEFMKTGKVEKLEELKAEPVEPAAAATSSSS